MNIATTKLGSARTSLAVGSSILRPLRRRETNGNFGLEAASRWQRWEGGAPGKGSLPGRASSRRRSRSPQEHRARPGQLTPSTLAMAKARSSSVTSWAAPQEPPPRRECLIQLLEAEVGISVAEWQVAEQEAAVRQASRRAERALAALTAEEARQGERPPGLAVGMEWPLPRGPLWPALFQEAWLQPRPVATRVAPLVARRQPIMRSVATQTSSPTASPSPSRTGRGRSQAAASPPSAGPPQS